MGPLSLHGHTATSIILTSFLWNWY